MKKIEKNGRTFKVIPESKVVIGTQERSSVWNDMDGISVAHKRVIVNAIDELYDDFYDDDVIKVKAKCDKRDEFSEKAGINICESKLARNNHRILAKRYDRAYRILTECANFVYKRCAYHMAKIKAIDDDLEKTYGGKIS